MVLGILTRSAASLDFALELGDSVFVLCFHLVVLLLQRIHLAANQLNLLNMPSDLAFVVDAALRLGLKLGADVVEEVVQALTGAALGAAHDAGRVAVVHGRGLDAARRLPKGWKLGVRWRRSVCAVNARASGDSGARWRYMRGVC